MLRVRADEDKHFRTLHGVLFRIQWFWPWKAKTQIKTQCKTLQVKLHIQTPHNNSFVTLFIPSFITLLIRSFITPFIHHTIHSSYHSFIILSNHSSHYSFITLLIHSITHSITHSTHETYKGHLTQKNAAYLGVLHNVKQFQHFFFNCCIKIRN